MIPITGECNNALPIMTTGLYELRSKKKVLMMIDRFYEWYLTQDHVIQIFTL